MCVFDTLFSKINLLILILTSYLRAVVLWICYTTYGATSRIKTNRRQIEIVESGLYKYAAASRVTAYDATSLSSAAQQQHGSL